MSRRIPHFLAIHGLCLAAGHTLAGPLDPPAGPPTSTFKTLGDVEPRKAVQSLSGQSNALYVISEPGSYYLTGNIVGQSGKHGILIAADNVSVDLHGFSVIGVGGADSGIVADSRIGVRVSNGSVRGWPSWNVYLNGSATHASGLTVQGGGSGMVIGPRGVVNTCTLSGHAQIGIMAASGASISNTTVQGCGHTGIQASTGAILTGCTASQCLDGFSAGAGSIFTDCIASQNNAVGFAANSTSFRNCTASLNTTHGYSLIHGCTLEGCIARENTGNGVNAFDYCTISNCTVLLNHAGGAVIGRACVVTGSTFCQNDVYGLWAGDSCTVSRCTAAHNAGCGILATAWCTITDNNCLSNTGPSGGGIRVSGAGNRIEANALNSNPVGVHANVGGNMIIRNSFTFNQTRINAVAGNNIAQMIVVPGNDFAATNPLANLAY